MIYILNTALFMVNGNNLVVSEDMLRRVLRSTIDPGVECPESRVFTTVRPDHLVDRHRAKYVIAGLTVLRAFHVAGSRFHATINFFPTRKKRANRPSFLFQ